MGAIEDDLIRGSKSVFLIGIGGVGMSALARVLKHRGLKVSGSDSKRSKRTDELELCGIPVAVGQKQLSFQDADLVIYSSAISASHFELQAARASGIKVHHRAEILASLFNKAATSIAVTGTHGKTTTSSMVSYLLAELGRDPTCLIGGDVRNFGTNTRLGRPDFWVSEVDESDQSHMLYAPNYAILTNLEEDHLENYGTLDHLVKSFEAFLSNLRNPGLLIYCGDDPIVRSLARESGKPAVSYGLDASNDFSAQNVSHGASGVSFDLCEAGFYVTRVSLSVPGVHNVLNSLAVISLLIHLGISPEEMLPALQRFQGAGRRLEVRWTLGDLTIVDDYAHHPTEVRASLAALKAMGRKVTAVFQPHRYSRTQRLYREFGSAFEDADEIILAPVYSAGENNPDGIGSDLIYGEILASGHDRVKMLSRDEILPYLLSRGSMNGILVFMGAGDIGELADGFTDRLKSLASA